MIIKKYVGKTEEEAVEVAKKELGNGVVIMNVKNVKRKGLMALFGARLIEVTVALEGEPESAVKPHKEPVAGAEEAAAATRNRVSLTSPNIDSTGIEKRLDSLQALLESRLKDIPTTQDGAKKSEDAKAEDAEKAEAEAEVSEENAPREENTEQEKFIRLLYNTMIDSEVDEKYANQILEEIEKNKKPNIPIDYILANVYQKMILKFGKSEGIRTGGENPHVVVFVGPTGVGKTTTIAKVASSLVVDEKKRVALLTADTYRIAAAEQLRTYANILEVAFRVIYTPEELRQALMDFKEFDYIFLDTTGHSHQNENQLEKTEELLHAIDELADRDTFLVLSATTKRGDLLKIAQKYKQITDFQLIFTKLDETTALGNLLNVKLYVDSPIAYVTLGQNVPDDIERFNPQKTVKQLLGGGH